MKKLNRKKGFTIVELVIVIAVVGVLTAVLVPTFVNLANQAKRAENQTFVRNLNTQMGILENDPNHKAKDEKTGEEIVIGGENHTMYDAIVDAMEIGHNVERLTPVDGNDIIWDSVANRFAIVASDFNPNSPDEKKVVYSDGGLKGKGVQLWKMYGKSEMPAPAKQTYSIYAKETTSWDNIDIENLHVGFDAGKNTKINSIHYVGSGNSQDVVIRTNSDKTTLTINAPTDTIKHYDELGTLNIIESATSSYHENGKVSVAEISKGRIVLEKGSDVEEIHVNAKVDEGGNKLNEFDTVIVAYDASVNMNDVSFSRDEVEIAEQGTRVVALQNGTEAVTESTKLDYIWLTKQGIYEQIKVSDSAESAGDVWADDANNSTTTQEAAKQIANNIGRNADTQQIDVNVTVAEVTYAVSVDPTTRDLVLTNTETSEVASERITEAVAKGIADSTVMDSSINEVETEMFEEENASEPDLSNFVARIGLVGYNSFAEAYAAAEAGNTIVLLKDISLTSSISLSKTLKLNLNGKTITSTATIFNCYGNYTLTISDTTAEKLGTIDVTKDKAIYISSGKLILESGNLIVHSNSSYAKGVEVGSSGSFEMNGGSITIPSSSTATYNYCINNGGNTTINGGTLIAQGNGGNYTVTNSSSGSMTITGGTFDAYAYAAGFKSPYVLYITGGSCNVSGGHFRAFGDKNTYSVGYLAYGSGTFSISGGYFGGSCYYGLSSDVITEGYQCVTNTEEATKADYKFVVVIAE